MKKSLKIVAMTEIKLRKLIQISILCNKNLSNILYEALCEFLFILVGSWWWQMCRHDICQKIYTAGFSGQKFTPSISPNFNSFSDKNTKKWVKMEKFTPLAKNFTLPPSVTAGTNLTSGAYKLFLIFNKVCMFQW